MVLALRRITILCPHQQPPQDIFRWARIMCEMFKEAWARVQDVAQQAQIEIAIKLQVSVGA